MSNVRDYQKRWDKFIEQIITHSKHWSKYQKLWASNHILEQLWINPEYGVPTPVPKNIFWKAAKRYHITEFGPEMPFAKHSPYLTGSTYSINHKGPVPLETTIGMSELISKALNHLNPQQMTYFDQKYKKNINDPTLNMFKVDHMLTMPY